MIIPRHDEKANAYRIEFNTWTELLDNAAADYPDKASQSSRTSWGSPDNNCYASFDEAIERSRLGDRKLTADVLKISEMLPTAKEHARRRRPMPALSGHAPIVGAYLAGEPMSMLRFTQSEGRPIIRIGVNGTISGGCSGDLMKIRGAAVLALVNALESSGYAVGVDILIAVRGSGSTLNITAPVKPTGSYADAGILASALLTATPCRRLFFAIGEQLPDDLRISFGCKPHGGYGYPCGHIDRDNYDIYMKEVHLDDRQFATTKAAADWCRIWLEKITNNAKATV